jgi:hypothetical protein
MRIRNHSQPLQSEIVIFAYLLLFFPTTVIPLFLERDRAYLGTMTIFKEARHLETLKCYYNESMDVFIFCCAGKKITIQYASPEQIASVFRKAQVKDESTEPRSIRGKTYLEMVASVIDGTDQTNYLWSTCADTFFAACEALVQSRVGQQVKPN